MMSAVLTVHRAAFPDCYITVGIKRLKELLARWYL